jgi:RNA polymerase sigma-70 factor (ECF subfamily)
MTAMVSSARFVSKVSASEPALDEAQLLGRLRDGDESAFGMLVDLYHGSLIRIAMMYVRDRNVAEEVVQEVWLGVIGGIERFEERCSLKTWIFRILAYTAKTRAKREGRTIPLTSIGYSEDSGEERAVEPDRFFDTGQRWPGHWVTAPASWEGIPESRLLAKESLSFVREAIAKLPQAQREVITLRDVEGWDSGEVCEFLHLSEANQRVLLHRARSKVRRALEDYLEGED